MGTNGVTHSTDGGSTWSPFMKGITELHVYDLTQVNNVLYATTDKGIAKSTDGGELWTSIETELLPSFGKSLGALQLSNMTVVGNSVYVRAERGGGTNSLFHLLQGSDKLLPIKGMPVYVDSDQGEWLESIAYISSVSDLDETDLADLSRYQLSIGAGSTGTVGEFAVSGKTFYIEYDRTLYRWIPGDLKWHNIGVQDTPVFADFYATDGFQFAVSGNIVYLGKSNGQLCQSLDSGDTWRDITANFPLPLNSIESPEQVLKNLPHFKDIIFAGNAIYVATSDGVAMSNDGENWRVLTDSEQIPIAICQLTVDGATLYGVSETGVYRLNSETGIWIEITSEVPDRVTSLIVMQNALYIGTEHRGVLRLPLSNL